MRVRSRYLFAINLFYLHTSLYLYLIRERTSYCEGQLPVVHFTKGFPKCLQKHGDNHFIPNHQMTWKRRGYGDKLLSRPCSLQIRFYPFREVEANRFAWRDAIGAGGKSNLLFAGSKLFNAHYVGS